MPRRKNFKRKGKSNSGGRANPPAGTVRYAGPIFSRSDLSQQQTITRVLVTAGGFTSSVSGTIALAITNNPSTSPDWSSYVNTYERFRVLATELEYVPFFEHFSNTAGLAFTQQALAYNTSRDILAVPASLSNVLSNPSAKLTNTQCRFKIRGRMDGTLDAGFIPTVSPVSTWTHQVYATNLPLNTQYGNFALRIRVQFQSPH